MLAASMRLSILALLLFAGVSCSHRPELLVDDLFEGMEEQQVLAVLGAPPRSATVMYEYTSPGDDCRPPYSEKRILVSMAKCAGQSADVEVSFYLGALSEVVCYPKDQLALIGSLNTAGIVNSSKLSFNTTRRGVEIQGRQQYGRWSVTFISKRLAREQLRWITKYS